MCSSMLCDLTDNCDCDQTGWGLFLLGDILTKESFGGGARRFIWWEQGLVWLWKMKLVWNGEKYSSSATCWGGWCDDVRADFPGHLLQRSKFLQITWFNKFDTRKKGLPFHLSSQTLWRSSRSACSRCSREVPHLAEFNLKALLFRLKRKQSSSGWSYQIESGKYLLTWSGQSGAHIRGRIPCRA